MWDEIQDMPGEIFDIEELMLAEADVMSDPEFINLGVCPLEALEADDTRRNLQLRAMLQGRTARQVKGASDLRLARWAEGLPCAN
jgi:hypothetical protein